MLAKLGPTIPAKTHESVSTLWAHKPNSSFSVIELTSQSIEIDHYNDRDSRTNIK